ncbi:5-methyltetrahydropteroyltriglutamate-homocysteine methyltransferase [Acrasis kona]|uniref:5-methyltetrahydropteroyltriglutamate-homocysteine methyltransferase n=1 Tax=Acrasis kona TaxID=1008807 RepID=A0AAW2ZG81_9EUKA
MMKQVLLVFALCAVCVLCGDPGGIRLKSRGRYSLAYKATKRSSSHKFGKKGPKNVNLPVESYSTSFSKDDRTGPHKLNFDILPMYTYKGQNGKMYTSCQMDCESSFYALSKPAFNCTDTQRYFSYSVYTKKNGATSCPKPLDISQKHFLLALNICRQINNCKLTKEGESLSQSVIDKYEELREVFIGKNEDRTTSGVNKPAKQDQLKALAEVIATKKKNPSLKNMKINPDPKAINQVLF